MKQDIGWGLKNILLPLSPFLIGTLLKWSYEESLSLGILDASRLSFSMAILCIILLKSSSQLNDADLNDSLTSIFGFGVIIYLALFATSSLIQIHIEHQTIDSLDKVSELIKNSQLDALNGAIYKRNQDKLATVLRSISVFAMLFTLIVIPFTVISRRRFNLK